MPDPDPIPPRPRRTWVNTAFYGPNLGPHTTLKAALTGAALVVVGMLGGIDPHPTENLITNIASIASIILGVLLVITSIAWTLARGGLRIRLTQVAARLRCDRCASPTDPGSDVCPNCGADQHANAARAASILQRL